MVAIRLSPSQWCRPPPCAPLPHASHSRALAPPILSHIFFNAVAFCLFQIRQRLGPFFRQMAARSSNFFKTGKTMKNSQQQRSSSKSTETLVEGCAFILLLLMASEADVAVGGSSVVEVPLDNLYHFNPCSFNPLCVCSTGGRFRHLDFFVKSCQIEEVSSLAQLSPTLLLTHLPL